MKQIKNFRPFSTKNNTVAIYCNGHTAVNDMHATLDNVRKTPIFNFFLRKEIPYTNVDSVV